VARAIQKRGKSLEDGRNQGLSQLFDLNRILYTAGDSNSLLKLSLEFALMQSRSEKGIIIYWDTRTRELKSFQTKETESDSYLELNSKIEEELIVEWSDLKEIVQITNPDKYPLFHQMAKLLPQAPTLINILKGEGDVILIPLRKAEYTSGAIALQRKAGEGNLPQEDLKLLTILGIQAAISLENLTLLIETKESYRELQNLQDQIIGLEKMATQGRISAEIGHELNNFLTVIMGNFQILGMKMDKEVLESVEKQLDTISVNLEKVKSFAEGLLDFSSLKVRKSECDINQLVEKTMGFIRPQNAFKNISLLTELKPNLPHLLVDPGQIQQVLYNLLNNAADAMGKRKGEGGTITIKTDSSDKEKAVEIWVKDTGKGMTPEQVENIFTAGFTTKQTGHGMGLSICRKIIAHHGGTIRVESELNKGTTFKIMLPI
jgi:two-component system NtrC family sensor kinase